MMLGTLWFVRENIVGVLILLTFIYAAASSAALMIYYFGPST